MIVIDLFTQSNEMMLDHCTHYTILKRGLSCDHWWWKLWKYCIQSFNQCLQFTCQESSIKDLDGLELFPCQLKGFMKMKFFAMSQTFATSYFFDHGNVILMSFTRVRRISISQCHEKKIILFLLYFKYDSELVLHFLHSLSPK